MSIPTNCNSNEMATVFNIQHFSTHDGPGIRTVIFLKGCPLDCIWCHNPEGKRFSPDLSYNADICVGCGRCAEGCPQGVHAFVEGRHLLNRAECIGCGQCAKLCHVGALELIGQRRPVREIVDDAARDAVFFGEDGGITLSGGEPLAQSAVLAILSECKRRGFSTCVETSGQVSAEVIRAASVCTDFFLYDCKLTDSSLHKQYVGTGDEVIRSNLALLNELGAQVVLRCPIIPGINDNFTHYENISAISARYSCIKAVELEPYHPLGIAKETRIGCMPRYKRSEFLPPEQLEPALARLREACAVPVRLS